MLHDVYFYVNRSSIKQLGKNRNMDIFPRMFFFFFYLHQLIVLRGRPALVAKQMWITHSFLEGSFNVDWSQFSFTVFD